MGAYTLDFLREFGPKYAMGYLLPRISAHSSMTYGEIANRLRTDLNINGRIFPTHIGSVAGPLQDRIHTVSPHAPLLNALIVRADDDEASVGIEGYLRRKYHIPNNVSIDDKKKKELLQRAVKEVYAFKHWNKIYEKAFNEPPPFSTPFEEINGIERDGQIRGGPAESEEHRRLKAYVLSHPAIVGVSGRITEKRDEFYLYSGDEIDVFFASGNNYWLIEVKSERSNACDLLRGCYQCVKYRAVFEAQIGRSLQSVRVNTILVTTTELTPDAKAIARDQNISHIVIRRI